MDAKRLLEWLKTAEGGTKALIGLLGVPAAIWVGATSLDPDIQSLGLSPWITKVVAVALILGVAALLVRSYLGFAEASRIEKPDAFTLRATKPDELIGRSEYLSILVDTIKRHRIVLLDGESGCGKSAIITAGVAPEFCNSRRMLPVLIRDWGGSWTRDPTIAVLDGLYMALDPSELEKIGWTHRPDLTGSAEDLLSNLGRLIDLVFSKLGHRVLLLADQFDDYQARHHSKFVDSSEAWISPNELAASNPFWDLIRRALQRGAVHLLVASRSDAAAGQSCLRFLDSGQISTRTLPRVEIDYLYPLLVGIAPEGSNIVSNPASGWDSLRKRLERDLTSDGSILMQQVRTVLLGVRQLRVLSVKEYRSAGGLRGVETLVIERAVRRASLGASNRKNEERAIRSLLSLLVLPGSANQPPKARRATISSLRGAFGGDDRLDLVLDRLHGAEIVRPSESVEGEPAWQLDHDYLAHAVLSDATRADYWPSILREGSDRFLEAQGVRQRYKTLLSMRALAVVTWLQARGRLNLGTSRRYVLACWIKPATAFLVFGAIVLSVGFWNDRRALSNQAMAMVDQYGAGNDEQVTLMIWRSPESLKKHVYKLVSKDKFRLRRLASTKWPLAHGELEHGHLLESAIALRRAITLISLEEMETESWTKLGTVYAGILGRLDDRSQELAASEAFQQKILQNRRTLAYKIAPAYLQLLPALGQLDRVQALDFLEDLMLDLPSFNASEKIAEAVASYEPTLVAPLLVKVGGRLSADEFRVYAPLYHKVARLLPADEHETARSELKRLDDLCSCTELEELRSILVSKTNDQRLIASEANSALTAYVIRTSTLSRYSELAKALTDQATIHEHADTLQGLLDRAGTDPDLLDLYVSLVARVKNPNRRQQHVAQFLKFYYELDAARAERVSILVNTMLPEKLDYEFAEAQLSIARDRFRLSDSADQETLRLNGSVVSPLQSINDATVYAGLGRHGSNSDVSEAVEVLSASPFGHGHEHAFVDLAARMTDVDPLGAAMALSKMDSDTDAFATALRKLDSSGVRALIEHEISKHEPDIFLIARLAIKQDDRSVLAAIAPQLTSIDLVERIDVLKGVQLIAALQNNGENHADAESLLQSLAFVSNEEDVKKKVGAYVIFARKLLQDASTTEKKNVVRDLLILASHPYLSDSKIILATLESASGEKFDNDISRAVRWAETTYGLNSTDLRPALRLRKEEVGSDRKRYLRETVEAITQ